ncbi:2778_t:CDS:2, partial [Ambispora gerdemannii]
SASSNVTEEKPAPTLAEVEDLQLDEDDFKILRDDKISGRDFLKLGRDDFERHGMKLGPASRIVDFAKEYGVEAIPLFELPRYEIEDNDQHFAHCMADILFRMKHYGSLVLDSLESMRNEYVSTLLHTALHIAGDLTRKEFSMRPEYEIVGDESSGRVDYGIKESENLICVTEDKVQRSILEEISQASEVPYSIEFNKKALEKKLRGIPNIFKGVKKVLGIIVELLKDRACVEKSPDSKRARVEGYRTKK